VGETKGEDDEQEKKVGGRGHGVRQMPVLRNIDFFVGSVLSTPLLPVLLFSI